jgi:hypothetical protein
MYKITFMVDAGNIGDVTQMLSWAFSGWDGYIILEEEEV